MFDHTSRYYKLETATLTRPEGRIIAYKRRRFLPMAQTMTILAEVLVTRGDRLDFITFRTLGDPEQFWRVCDANNTMKPSELTEKIGAMIHIPLPQGQV